MKRFKTEAQLLASGWELIPDGPDAGGFRLAYDSPIVNERMRGYFGQVVEIKNGHVDEWSVTGEMILTEPDTIDLILLNYET